MASVLYRLRRLALSFEGFTRAGFWCALDAQLAPRAVPPPSASTTRNVTSLGSEDPSYIGISSFCALVPSSLATRHSSLATAFLFYGSAIRNPRKRPKT
jgi:hypothetical protein